jgi:hypothetical protein
MDPKPVLPQANNEHIQGKIYVLRGQRVMLDVDLAGLYNVETKQLKRAVKRNIARFPTDFMFEITRAEWKDLRYHFGTSSWGGARFLPFAFTEQGVAMLSSVLRSEHAIQMNIAIMRAFIVSRQLSAVHGELLRQLAELTDRVGSHDQQLASIYAAIENLLDDKAEQQSWADRERIGFKVHPDSKG